VEPVVRAVGHDSVQDDTAALDTTPHELNPDIAQITDRITSNAALDPVAIGIGRGLMLLNGPNKVVGALLTAKKLGQALPLLARAIRRRHV